jgi:uncharacterized membrane protein
MVVKQKKEDANNQKQKSHPVLRSELTFEQKASDILTSWAGSWTFIFTILICMGIWMGFNYYALAINQWDPYPFILLNFVLSTLAALQAPVILMSQNREAERDRINSKYDYQVNRKAEREIQALQKDVTAIRHMLSGKKRR